MRTILYIHRRSDYTQDIFEDGIWVASAKTWGQADTVELVTACAACEQLGHTIQSCPEIKELLMEDTQVAFAA